MAFNIEPIHDRSARTTSSSKFEGRLRQDVSGISKKRKKKNRYVLEALDGKGGCGKKKKY